MNYVSASVRPVRSLSLHPASARTAPTALGPTWPPPEPDWLRDDRLMSGHRGPLDRSLSYGVRSWPSTVAHDRTPPPSITTFLFPIHLPRLRCFLLLPVSPGAGYISRPSTDRDTVQRQPHSRRAYRVSATVSSPISSQHTHPPKSSRPKPQDSQVSTTPPIPYSLEQSLFAPARSLCPPVSKSS